ncbi:hypothetical protein ACFQPA_03355 [Halomarina halobia]|uniref:Uncharacterized protein n=1 Tax=Halomarina halobia TaxID=3033386 RepID=A0ABD6A624_9EURY|nr:hypothetical protein [Halomarina sp. PSR21]
MADTELTEDFGSDSGGGKVKRTVGVLAVLAVLLVLLKLRRGGSSDEGEGESEEYVELDESDEREGVDTVTTSKDEGDEIEVTTSTSKFGGGRLEELDVVDYLGILAAALQAARDEYRIRTNR